MAIMMQAFYWDAPKHENKEHEWWNFVAERVEDLGRAQLHISLMQPVLRFPCNLLGLFRNALLPSAQTVPNTWRTTIAPCSFDNDSSQVRVAGLRDGSAPGSLTTGILAWYNAAVTHQLASALEAGYLAQLARNGHSRAICDAAQCCKSLITCCIAGVASFTASMMACSRRSTRPRMCSTSCR